MNERGFERYEEAYSLLDELTLIPADCGKLCKRKCCHGGKDDGMLLFAGEEEFLDGQRFLKVSEREFCGGTAKMAVCKGRCKREWRPLSCRIYPFAPRMKEDGTIEVTPDPRAKYICPLLASGAEQYWDAAFAKTVQQAFELLLEVEGMPEFLRKYTQMLESYDKFVG